MLTKDKVENLILDLFDEVYLTTQEKATLSFEIFTKCMIDLAFLETYKIKIIDDECRNFIYEQIKNLPKFGEICSQLDEFMIENIKAVFEEHPEYFEEV